MFNKKDKLNDILKKLEFTDFNLEPEVKKKQKLNLNNLYINSIL